MAHLEAGRVKEANATASTQALLEIGTQGQQSGGQPTDEAAVAHQLWKCLAPVHADVIQVVGLEGAIALLVESHQNRHDFAEAQAALPIASLQDY